MTSTFLDVRREGAVEYVRLNRPDVRNALNEELIAHLMSWATAAAEDRSLRAAVLSGAGSSFCSGADLAWMAKMAAYTHDDNIKDATVAAQMFAALDRLPFPVIARIHGAAIGGGTGLASIADIAVAEAGATFGFTEVRLGLVPAIIAPYVLAKIGESAARELFLTGRRFGAQEARSIGLVHAVVPAEELDRTIKSYVEDILAGGPEAVAAAKVLIRQMSDSSRVDSVQQGVKAIAERRVSAEAQARMTAFLKK